MILGSIRLFAEDVYWTSAAGDRLWTNSKNWNAGTPKQTDAVRLNKPVKLQPLFTEKMRTTVKAVFIGISDGEVAGFEMTGGKLTVTGAFEVNKNDTMKHKGQFTMSGGILSVGGNFRVGWNDNDAQVLITGGRIETEYGNAGAKSRIILQDGVINAHWNWLMNEGSKMDIQGGQFIVRSIKREEQLRSYIDNGNIIA